MALYGGVNIAGRPDLENVRRLDLLPIPMIRRAHRLGFCIDPPHFHELTSKFTAEMLDVEKDIASYIPIDRLNDFSDRAAEVEEAIGDIQFNAASSEQIGRLLFDILGIGRDKPLKKTKAGDRLSTGKRQLELIRLDHPVVARVG